MQSEVIAVIFQETGRLLTALLKIREPKKEAVTKYPMPSVPPAEPQEIAMEEDKIKKGTACLPCTNSHLLTCVGLLNEAYRMSPDNLTPDSIERVDKCLAEIAAAERVDLAPDNIANLPDEEKTIAHYALKEMRDVRHGLEGLSTKDQLEILAAKTSEAQKHVSKEWFKMRLAKMPKEEKLKVAEKALERLEKES